MVVEEERLCRAGTAPVEFQGQVGVTLAVRDVGEENKQQMQKSKKSVTSSLCCLVRLEFMVCARKDSKIRMEK